MNTFQTPEVMKPREGVWMPGLMVGPDGARWLENNDRNRLPIGRGLVLAGRYGLLLRLDAGAQIVGFSAFGADVKYQFVQSPVRVAANAGLGLGRWKTDGNLLGYDYASAETQFASVMVGAKSLYGAVKLTRYNYSRETDSRVPFRYDRVVPGFTVGLSSNVRNVQTGILEVNTYFFPHLVFTFGFGVQFHFGRQ